MTDVQPAYATRFRMPIGDPERPFHGVNAQTDNWHFEGDRGQDHGDFFGGSPMAGSGQFHHLGEDWNWGSGRDDVGAPIHAVAHGTVIYVGAPWQTVALSGHMVILRHELPPGSDDGHGGRYVYSLYAHITPTEGLAVGQHVAIGQQIGAIADLAIGSFSPHLHFEMRWKDPAGIPETISPDYVLPTGYIGTGYFQAEGTENAAAQANAMGWVDPSDFVEARLADGERDDFADGPGTSGRIVIGEISADQAWGVLEQRPEGQFDTDWFAVDLQAGVTYAFAVRGLDTAAQTQGNPTLANPSLRIRDPEGAQITWDGQPWEAGQQTADDGAGGRDVRVTFTAPADGTYHLVVFSSTQETGSYRLSGIETAAPPPATPASPIQPVLKGPDDGSVWATGTGTQFPTRGAFAALREDGSVYVWGTSGTHPINTSPLNADFVDIFSGPGSFHALRADGAVISWNIYGFARTPTVDVEAGAVAVSSTQRAFAALKSDGSVETWGAGAWGGSSADVAERLQEGVVKVYSHTQSFAAVKSDGSVVTWGGNFERTDVDPEPGSLDSDVLQVFSTSYAFAALKSDGSVVAWGDGARGGDASAVADLLASDVVHVFSTRDAFAALKSDGSLVTWGAPHAGGDGDRWIFQDGGWQARGTPVVLEDIVTVRASTDAFAAIRSDGTVVAWGNETSGAIIPEAVAANLVDVVELSSTRWAFSALTASGAVHTWGVDTSGADHLLTEGIARVVAGPSGFVALTEGGAVISMASGPSADQQVVRYYTHIRQEAVPVDEDLRSGVETIYVNTDGFAALKDDGSVVSWGFMGQDPALHAEPLGSGVIGLASPFGSPFETGQGQPGPAPEPLPNRPPVADLVAVVTSEVGDEATLDIAARFSDPDDDPLTFSFDGLPGGITAQGGQLTGTLTAAPGDYTVTVTAADGRGGTATASFLWQVLPVPEEPTDPPYRPSSYDLEYIARMVAYGHDNSGLPEGYVALTPFDGVLGFRAIPLISATGEPVLAIRGTASALDAVTNSDVRSIGYSQVEEIWPQLRNWLADNPGTHIVGHSLGGAQAQLVAAWATEAGIPLGQVATFNAPGINAGQVARFDPALTLGVQHYIASGDVVSMAGEAFLPGDVLFYNFETLSFPDPIGPGSLLVPFSQVINAHTGHWAQPSMWSLVNEDGTPRFPQNPFSELYRIAAPTLTVEDLGQSSFSHISAGTEADLEYMTFLLGLSAVGLPTVSAGLASRGSAEAMRKGIGFGVLGTVEVLELGAATLRSISAALDTVQTWSTEVRQAVTSWTADTWRGVASWSAETWGAITDWGLAQWEGLSSWSATQWGLAGELTAEIWAGMQDWSSETWAASKSWGTETFNNIRNFGAGVVDGIGNAAATVGEAVEGVTSTVGGFFKGSTTLWGLLSRSDPVEVVAVDGGSWTYQGEATPVLVSGAGSTLLASPQPGSTFILGDVGTLVEMSGGGNTIFGIAETLDASTLSGFGASDRIIYAGMTVGSDAKAVSSGSAIISIDLDGDGVSDSSLRLTGDFDLSAFRLMLHADGMALFYGAPSADEVADVRVEMIARDGTPVAGAELALHRPGGSAGLGRSDETGAVLFEVMRGVEGELQGSATAGAAAPSIGVSSALEALRLALGLPASWGPARPMDFVAADLNGDGQVNVADALGILRVALGLPSEHAPRWVFVDAEADLSALDRTNTLMPQGLRLDPVTDSATGLTLTGILVGHVQEYA